MYNIQTKFLHLITWIHLNTKYELHPSVTCDFFWSNKRFPNFHLVLTSNELWPLQEIMVCLFSIGWILRLKKINISFGLNPLPTQITDDWMIEWPNADIPGMLRINPSPPHPLSSVKYFLWTILLRWPRHSCGYLLNFLELKTCLFWKISHLSDLINNGQSRH